VGEISVSSAAYLPETFLRSIATCFTSELDVQHRPGGASVATDLLLAGGFEIERDPEGLLAALAAGLPLRGGTGPRTINDLLTLAESPLGWPIPIGRPIPGLPSSIAHEQAPERLTVTDQEPETIDAIGSTRRGDPIGLPVDLRSRHTVITGSWGSGKSTVASHLMVQDLQHRRPFMLIDPHGSLADHVILWAQRLGRDYIHLDPENPTTGTIAPFDLLAPDGSNLEHVEGQISRYLDAVAASLPDPTFASVRWYSIAQSWALVQAAHGASTEEAMVWLNDGDLLVEMAHHPLVPVNARRTLEAVAGPRASRDAAEIRTWVSSKFHALVSGPIRRLLAAPGAAPTVMELVAQDATVVCNLRSLSPGEAAILGHLTASAAIAGVMDRPPAARSLYSCFMDEAHRFPADSLRRGLTEGRKFGLGLVLIAQSHSQFSAELADLVSVAGTQIFFRATPETAARASLFLDAPASLLRLPDLDGVVLVNGEQPVTISVPPYSEPDDPAPGAESAERIGEPSEDDQPMPGDPSPPPPIDAKRRTLTRLIQKENQRLMAAQPENEDRLDVLEPPEEA
jgi:hypothetical protein